MVDSNYLQGFYPATPDFYARPVQDEDATAGLSGAELDDGTGILLWAYQSDVRFALVSSPLDFVVDDVVPLADIQTALSTGGNIEGTSVFTANGGLYFLIEWRDAFSGFVELYQADDNLVPTSWSLKSLLQTADTTSGNVFGTNRGCGHPLILDDGRWVLCSPRYTTEGGTFWRGMNVGAWYSDDDGTSWVSTVNYGHVYFFTRAEVMSRQVGVDPITGDLYFSSSTTTSFVESQTTWWRSTDLGSSFFIADSGGGNYGTEPRNTLVVHNGTNAYTMEADLSAGGSISWGIYSNTNGPGSQFTDWAWTSEKWLAPGASPDEKTMKAVVTRITVNAIFYFTLDQVMWWNYPLTPTFTIPPLHIPFKDRLKNVRQLDP